MIIAVFDEAPGVWIIDGKLTQWSLRTGLQDLTEWK